MMRKLLAKMFGRTPVEEKRERPNQLMLMKVGGSCEISASLFHDYIPDQGMSYFWWSICGMIAGKFFMLSSRKSPCTSFSGEEPYRRLALYGSKEHLPEHAVRCLLDKHNDFIQSNEEGLIAIRDVMQVALATGAFSLRSPMNHDEFFEHLNVQIMLFATEGA